jgi:uncharacterized lipoprotein YmbA
MILLFSIFFFAGCGGGGAQYLLSVPTVPAGVSHRTIAQIGVDQVAVPDYLHGNKIAQEEAPGQLSFRADSAWGSAPEKALTNHLIRYLEKYFNTPNVHRFPWDIEKRTGVRLKVVINRFIYTGGYVELEASYYVEPMVGQRRRAKLFATRVAVAKAETPRIVAAMNRAFDRLATDAARTINHF